MTFNPSPSSFTLEPASITGPNSNLTASRSAHRPLSTLSSVWCTDSQSSPTFSDRVSGLKGANDGTGPYSYANAVSEISEFSRQVEGTHVLTMSDCDTDRREKQEFAECVNRCFQELEAEDVRDPNGKDSQFLKKIIVLFYERGIDLDFLNKPLEEKTQNEADLTVAAYLLIGYMGLGVMINCAVACYHFPKILERLRNTPQDAEGIWGSLRRVLYRTRAEESVEQVEEGFELDSMSTPQSQSSGSTENPSVVNPDR